MRSADSDRVDISHAWPVARGARLANFCEVLRAGAADGPSGKPGGNLLSPRLGRHPSDLPGPGRFFAGVTAPSRLDQTGRQELVQNGQKCHRCFVDANKKIKKEKVHTRMHAHIGTTIQTHTHHDIAHTYARRHTELGNREYQCGIICAGTKI